MATRNIVFTAFLATSVDGYIARTDGSVDFLDAANATMTPGEDCGTSAYLASIDAIVMGRKTYLHVLSMENWMYGDVPLFVVSGEMQDLPVGSPPSVRLLRTREVGDILTVLNKYVQNVIPPFPANTVREYLSSTKIAKVYVDGGELVRSFINAGLLSEITITVIPKLISNGRSLFGGTKNVEMTLKACKHWDFGFVQSTYGMSYGP
jgi:dihydrofolate reductase